jgi:hypothetical protein
MKRLVLVLAACSKHAATPPPEAAPRDAAVDAMVCPGTAEDCAACLAGSGAACFHVAIATSPDVATRPWYQRGCDLNDLDSCKGLSWWHMAFGSHDDFVRATENERKLEAARLAATRKRCDDHDEKACEDAGL